MSGTVSETTANLGSSAMVTPSVAAFKLRMEQFVQAAFSSAMGGGGGGGFVAAIDTRIQAAMAPLSSLTPYPCEPSLVPRPFFSN